MKFKVNFLKENDVGMQRFTVKHIVLLIAIGCMLYLLPNNLPPCQLSSVGLDNEGLSSLLSSFTGSFYSNIIQESRYLILLDGLKTTVIISICATLFGTLLGALVCFMRMSPNRVLSAMAKVYISILRGMPVLVFLMLMFYVVFASVDVDPVIVSVIAFGMNFAAYVAEIYRAGINSIDKGQTEAGIAMGFTKVNTFIFIILPQTIQRILPVYKGEFISLVKMTSVVGYIAVQDLTKASDIIRSRTFDAFFPLVMVAILYFFISWVLMLVLEYIERVVDPRSKITQIEGV
ncbi:MAG: amino acid ABC transporter permease [Chlorobium sp.]|jgi:polar amino acid transport system substrate-binding protein|nr:amino acid ABC transporter permease [Chlorobium sp.]